MNIKLGKVLHHVRKEAGLSQRQVADVINCSRATYSCWENDDGEIPLSKLLLLLQYSNISLSEFISKLKEENNLKNLVISRTGPKEYIDLKAELAEIGDKIRILNQKLIF
jgi:transcriptional regulator with XRE-family HTH domain